MTLTPHTPYFGDILVAVNTKTRRNYSFTKAKVVTDFLPGLNLGDIIEWSTEGGNRGNLKARLADTITTDNPVIGVNRIVENYRYIPYVDVYALYFNSIPASQFDRMSVQITATDIIVSLNTEG